MIVGLNPGPDLRSMDTWHSSSGGASDVHGCQAAQHRVRVVEWVEECWVDEDGVRDKQGEGRRRRGGMEGEE